MRETAVRLATGLGAAFVGVLAWGRLELSRRDAEVNRRCLAVTQQSHVTDRYIRAVELLAMSGDSQIGGVYALERLGNDSAPDRQTISDVLCAFVREHGHGEMGEPVVRQPASVAAALTVVTRNHLDWKTRLDLVGANLTDANLMGADLTRANLFSVNLTMAFLPDADLTEARADRADLSYARLGRATLSRAHLKGANLYRSRAFRAQFDKAVLSKAVLRRAVLTSANFREAHLDKADLADASLSGADLTGADLTKADLRGANLKGAVLDRATFKGAVVDSRTQWPQGYAVPKGSLFRREGTDGHEDHLDGRGAVQPPFDLPQGDLALDD